MEGMQQSHPFIFTPSAWLGEGKIQLNMVEEELAFYTRWKVSDKDPEGKIECVQEIQVKGLSEVMHNQFLFSSLAPGTFVITLENPALGRVSGEGLITDKVIAWEFRATDVGFEGFEFYEKQPDGTYLMRAEYATADQFRTMITGKMWPQKKEESLPEEPKDP
jgi:hypothetical protein